MHEGDNKKEQEAIHNVMVTGEAIGRIFLLMYQVALYMYQSDVARNK